MNALPVQLGLAVIIGSHVWMLNDPEKQSHAIANLAAASLVLYGIYGSV